MTNHYWADNQAPHAIGRILQTLVFPFLMALGFATGGLLQAADPPLRIMPLGDSITVGYTDAPTWNYPFEFGYRSGLYSRLTAAGYNFIFVGDSPAPFENKYGDPTHGGTVLPKLDLRPLGQNGHNAYAGQGIGHVKSGIVGIMNRDQPDLILLLIGINGMNTNSPALLDDLVKTIYDKDKDVKLIVAQISPDTYFQQTLVDYNTYIRETLVPTYANKGYAISTVDLHRHFLTNSADPRSINLSCFAGGCHPKNPSYDKMAESWFEGIKLMLAKTKVVSAKNNSAANISSNSATKTAIRVKPSN